ncbi:NGG1 interacting factor 3-like protein [Mycena pura]|uniref:NGG1 interacting factor 3-like protein n=1 Tax=Mycena pura TaxID=153505 RepID=A0AAD6UV24_9AGAR|nr:NGG1 interacting factor 3-like protein [Mycena pura]
MASSILTKAVCSAMQRIAPTALAGSWDNVGLIIESPIQDSRSANRILLTIDLTPAVCDEALSLGARMIVSYHSPIFRPLKSFTLSSPLQTSLLRCAAGGVSVYSPHSALDGVWGGINDWLLSILCDGDAALTRPLAVPPDPAVASLGGDGRRVEFAEPMEMAELEGRVKRGLGLSTIQVGYSSARQDRQVRSVAICAGAGASMFSAYKEPTDVFFTGEMQHHDVLEALAKGTHVILCGHTNTERGYLPVLAAKLRAELENEAQTVAKLGDVEVRVSKTDEHPLQVV